MAVGSTVSREDSARRHVVCNKDELHPGQMRAVRVGRRRLALVRLQDGSYRAMSDTCPHEGASLSRGKVERMWVSDEVGRHCPSRERSVVVCPWHNFEFDADTGGAHAPKRLRVKTYEVAVEGEDVVVYA